MPSDPLLDLALTDLAELIGKREVSPVDLTTRYLARIAEVNPAIGAVVRLFPDEAMREAREAESEIRSGRYRGPLHGTVFAVKDQIDTRLAPSYMRVAGGAGSYTDATVVSRLREAGAIFLGKLVMSGQPNMAQPRNPLNLEHSTGGSSSGSGAAVAAGMCTFTLGEDSAGSVRVPASFCGVTGLIATYGRVSRAGLASMGWSIDHIGFLTRSAADAAHVLEAVAGHDSRDVSTVRIGAPQYSRLLGSSLEGVTIGVPTRAIEAPCMGVEPDVRRAFYDGIATLQSLGAQTVEIELPLYEEAIFAAFVIYTCEYCSAYTEILGEFSGGVRDVMLRRLLPGAITSAKDYLHVQRLRAKMAREYAALLQHVDAIATPTCPTTAPRISRAGTQREWEARQWWMSPSFAASANLAGLPAITIPCGLSSNSLPIGIQFMAKPFNEQAILSISHVFQTATAGQVHTAAVP